MNYAEERKIDVEKIKESKRLHKVIVAGPGTGKTFLFKELIGKKKEEGKKNFLAITFVGKLGDALADDLCGLAKTMTMHGFAREFVLNSLKGWQYYPDIYKIIKEDLKKEGIDSFKIGDKNYKEKQKHYKTIGKDDVIFYANGICHKYPDRIPRFDLILVDEFQDFNEIESKFIDILSKENEMVIVGDDDQALYLFKGSSPSHIRKKYEKSNTKFESHTLRFCSRCTEVIIKYFHTIVDKFDLNNPTKKRIRKEYIYYPPSKEEDSKNNSEIYLIKNYPPGMIAYRIKKELEDLIKNQKIEEVLVIGEARTCGKTLKAIARQLINNGFHNTEYEKEDNKISFRKEIIDAYKFLKKDKESLLGWRILGNPVDEDVKKIHIKNSITLDSIINGSPSKIKNITNDNINKLEYSIEKLRLTNKEIRRTLLIEELKEKNTILRRPLSNIKIRVCNILKSKGLGADVVFVIGFDQGKFPIKNPPKDSEVYQMLVSLTRAKKRIYFINTIDINVSSFINCLDKKYLTTDNYK